MMPADEFRLARQRMLEEQIAGRGIHEPRLLAAMGKVLRHAFVRPTDLAWAYSDAPLPIGHGQTISQPFIVALMTELLVVTSENRVLEIGTGSGYQAAIFGELAAEVQTLERVPELAGRAAKVLAALGYSHVHVNTGDGSLGWPQAAPYDRILVAAAAPAAPQPLLDQLAEGGLLIVPVGNRSVQRLEVWKRVGHEFSCEKSTEVCFVPLRGEFGWK